MSLSFISVGIQTSSICVIVPREMAWQAVVLTNIVEHTTPNKDDVHIIRGALNIPPSFIKTSEI